MISRSNLEKRFLGIVFIALVLSVLVFFMSSCNKIRLSFSAGLDDLIQIASYSTSYAEGVFYLMEVTYDYYDETDDSFWYRTVSDLSIEEYIKQSAKADLVKFTAAMSMADELAVYLEEDTQAQAISDANDAYEKIAAVYDLDEYSITLSDVHSLYLKKYFYDAVYEKITEDVISNISESDTKVIEVNYVCAKFGEYTVNSLEEIRKEIMAGNDFAKVCADAGLVANQNVELYKGLFSDEFDAVAFSLLDGEVSEIVEGSDGYYIIECVEDYLISASIAHNNEVISNAKEEAFQSAYQEFAAEETMIFGDDAWNSLSAQGL